MTFGPRTHTSPSAPVTTSAPEAGSAIRTSMPETRPHEPSTTGSPGAPAAIAPHVSVLP